MSGSGAVPELFYCHACSNEFHKSGDGLTCPQCHSDFTELIENDFDPRADLASPLAGHDPWGSATDPDEMDIDEYSRHPGSSWRDRRDQSQYGMRPDPYGARGQYGRDPVFGNFASMIQGMTGRHMFPQGPPEGFGPLPGQAPPQADFRSGQRSMGTRVGPGFQSYQRTYPQGGNGNGIHISFTSSTNTGGGWQTNNQQFDSFQDMFGTMFGNMGPPPGAAGAGGQPQNPLAALLGGIMNPANAQHGDAVYSQEAFDRIMSQLMEQHQTGGAPGPASEAAINGLPRKKVTEAMLDETTKQAECSICMDNVVLDEEVVILPCQHWFHFQCAEAWLKEHDTCPVCRAGITPKEGSRDTARAPTEAPLHDEDPFLLARRQSGTQEHPFVVPESPTNDRRRPGLRSQDTDSTSSSRQYGGDTGGGITGRVRSLFGGNGGSNTGNNGRR